MSGCGSVWLERCVRDAEAGGSNPLTPTIFLQKNGQRSRQASLRAATAALLLKNGVFSSHLHLIDSALKWTTHWTTTKEKLVHGSRHPESRQA